MYMENWDMKNIRDNEKMKTREKEETNRDKREEAIKSEKLRYKNADEIYE
ncbi:hypothetical protein [Lederbergia panacisoli]|nr:hypothetical protein [Lederbergia panacisoli]MCR2823692.1 hypothetical protein [Lederbergia panacisoli]